jgi:hypothetical protein
MQCDEFDVRLHKILDRRRLPDCDPHLRHHAQVCPRCGKQLTAALRLLEGLDLLEVPPLRDDFALRVIQQVVPASQTRRARWTPLAIAVAATLLIGLLPGLGYLLRSGGSWDLNAPDRSVSSGEIAYAISSTPANGTRAVDDSLWVLYGNSILKLYPEKTRERHRQRVSEFAEDLRPIATPFNAAVTAIRRSIPVGRSTDKGQPSASIVPRAAGVPSHA